MSICSKLLDCAECVRQACRWILRYKISPLCMNEGEPLPDLAIGEIDGNGTCPGIPNVIPAGDIFGEVAKYYSIIGTVVVVCVAGVLIWIYRHQIPWRRLANEVEDGLNYGRRMRDWSEEPLINQDEEAAGNGLGNVSVEPAGNVPEETAQCVPGNQEGQVAERINEPIVEENHEDELSFHGAFDDDDDEEVVWASPQAEIINESRYPKRSTRGKKPDRFSPSS